MQLIGAIVSAVIVLGSFIAVIMKFVQPINDLRVVIQKLNDNIDSLAQTNENQNKRLDRHGKEIDHLKNRVGTMETKMSIFHKE